MSTIPETGGASGPTPGKDVRERARLQTAAKEFESLFVGYMLKAMRSTLSDESMFGESFGGDMMQGMFDVEMARQLSRNSSFGIGDMLYRQMTGEQ